MAEFLTTNGTSFQIENIIIEAREELILISPYLQISKTFYERIKDASERNVRITIIYGKDELKPNERNSLAELQNVSLHFFENLHAKCYFNEESMVVTSMNMYEFSEKNNREMGILIRKEDDPKIFHKAKEEAASILKSSEIIPLEKAERWLTAEKKSEKDKDSLPDRGYCIRCGERIPYNIGKPYCRDCFREWDKFQNGDYIEPRCHACGEFKSTTIMKPECFSCFKKYSKLNNERNEHNQWIF